MSNGTSRTITARAASVISKLFRPADQPPQAPAADLRNDGVATAPDGQPIVRAAMESRLAGATVTGVRQAVGSHVTAGLDPEGLAMILREAEDGDPEAYLALAEEIEEKDLHYRSVLNTRKLQVSQLDTTVEPGGTTPIDIEIADDVRRTFLDSGLIDGCIFDMLDAVGKGFSVMEMMWKLSASSWTIASIEFCDPRFFQFDRATRRIPLRKDDNGQRVPLEPYKFIVCHIAGKSGIPIRGGLARAAAWAWMFKNFAVKDWVQFCEVYGVPFRLGKYAPGSSKEDIDALLGAVVSIASDAGAAIPSNMDISIIETKGAGGSADGGVFGGLAKYFDEQMSKAVLGQTGTTDSTGAKGLGSGTEHQEVREDIERADAKALMACINQQAVRVYVDFKYGPQENYPWLWIGRPEPKDVAIMIDAAARLVPLGFKVRADDIRAATGLNKPEEGDEVLTPPAAGILPPGGNAIPPADLKVDLNTASLYATLLASELDEGDAISRAARSQDVDVMAKAVKQILAVAAKSSTAAEFQRRLRALDTSIDVSPLADHLAILTFQALAGGITGDTLSRQGA